jgi:SNF2 family DNA or RNA helicase
LKLRKLERDYNVDRDIGFEVLDGEIIVKGLSFDEIEQLGELCSLKVIGNNALVGWYNFTELLMKLKELNYNNGSVYDDYSTNFINSLMMYESNIDKLKNVDGFEVSVSNLDDFRGSLYEVQKRGVIVLLMSRVLGLFFEMGMGKTPTSIYAYGLLRQYLENPRCLIISPLSVKLEWENMFKKFLDLEVYEAEDDIENKEIIITNYDRLIDRKAKKKDEVIESEVFRKLLKENFDVIIIDESHFIKNISSKRTRSVIEILKRTRLKTHKKFNVGKIDSSTIKSCGKLPYVWFLTGTPLEEVSDIFVFLRCGFGKKFVRYRDFLEYFTIWKEIYTRDRRKIRVFDAIKNESEFSRLVNKISITKDRSEIVEIDSIDKIIELDLSPKVEKEYIKIMNSEKDNILSKITKGIQLCNNPKLLNINLESEKLNALVDIINGTKSKVIVWTIFRDSVNMIKSRLDKEKIKSVAFMGGEDDEIVRKKFEDDCKVLISTIAKGSIGVNFMKIADVVIYMDRPFSYTQWIQSRDRVMRVDRDTSKPVLFIDLKMKSPFDEKENENGKKRVFVEEIIDRVMEKKTTLNKLIKEYENEFLFTYQKSKKSTKKRKVKK